MPTRLRAFVPVLPALLALASCGPAGAPVAEFTVQDLSTPAMVEELARGLGKAYVVELPSRPVEGRHSLELRGVSEVDVLIAIVKLDPSFQYRMRPDVLLFLPAGKDDEASPYRARVRDFQAQGSLMDVVHRLVTDGHLDGSTVISGPVAGSRRPVSVSVPMEGREIRDVLADLAAQAHVGMRIEPGFVRAFDLPE